MIAHSLKVPGREGSIVIRIACCLLAIFALCSSVGSADGAAAVGESSVDSAGGGLTYSMQLYTDAPNADSSVRVEYPRFHYTDTEENYYEYDSSKDYQITMLNELIEKKLAHLVSYIFIMNGFDSAVDIEYRCAVTLNTDKAVSVVFWGGINQNDQRYDRNIDALTVELSTMREYRLVDMFQLDKDFAKTLGEAGYRPANPEIMPETDWYSFDESLAFFQAETESARLNNRRTSFDFPHSLWTIGYLVPEGMVVAVSVSHADGNYFVVQVNREDISPFCLLDEPLWSSD
jgi:hypothetical protein